MKILVAYYSETGNPIEQFTHSTTVTDEDEWQVYIQEVGKHPEEDDLRKVRESAQEVLAGF